MEERRVVPGSGLANAAEVAAFVGGEETRVEVVEADEDAREDIRACFRRWRSAISHRRRFCYIYSHRVKRMIGIGRYGYNIGDNGMRKIMAPKWIASCQLCSCLVFSMWGKKRTSSTLFVSASSSVMGG